MHIGLVIDVRQTEPLRHKPSFLQLILPLKRYKLQGTDQILAQLIQEGGKILCSEIHKLIHSILNKINCKSIGSNLLLYLFIKRLTPYKVEIIGDHQCAIWCRRSAIDHIFCIHQTLERKWKYNGTVLQLFIDFKKPC